MEKKNGCNQAKTKKRQDEKNEEISPEDRRTHLSVT